MYRSQPPSVILCDANGLSVGRKSKIINRTTMLNEDQNATRLLFQRDRELFHTRNCLYVKNVVRTVDAMVYGIDCSQNGSSSITTPIIAIMESVISSVRRKQWRFECIWRKYPATKGRIETDITRFRRFYEPAGSAIINSVYSPVAELTSMEPPCPFTTMS